ncbi:hypothetical protein [Carboxylicivirga sp. RSCT41]|uniref:hypothetical protein n=1 Tax=Carboxylicivirga agarovorans TaxID=3417570 RepID=UPI003D32F7B9
MNFFKKNKVEETKAEVRPHVVESKSLELNAEQSARLTKLLEINLLTREIEKSIFKGFKVGFDYAVQENFISVYGEQIIVNAIGRKWLKEGLSIDQKAFIRKLFSTGYNNLRTNTRFLTVNSNLLAENWWPLVRKLGVRLTSMEQFNIILSRMSVMEFITIEQPHEKDHFDRPTVFIKVSEKGLRWLANNLPQNERYTLPEPYNLSDKEKARIAESKAKVMTRQQGIDLKEFR